MTKNKRNEKNIVLEYNIKNNSMVEFELSKKEFDLYMNIFGSICKIKIKQLFPTKNGRIIESRSLGEKASPIIMDDY